MGDQNKQLLEYVFYRKINSQLRSAEQIKDVLDLQIQGRVKLIPTVDSAGQSWSRIELNCEVQGRSIQSTLPVWVRKDSEGHLLDLKSATPRSDREREQLNFIRDWISLYAFREQRDPLGEYDARFIQEPAFLMKIKERYVHSSVPEIQILKSHHELYLTEKGEVSKIRGIERTRSPISGEWTLESRSEYKIELSQERETGPVFESMSESASIQLSLEQIRFEGRRSWSQIKKDFVDRALSRHPERLHQFHEVQRFLRSHPESVGEFKNLAESVRGDITKFQLAIGVFANLDSDEAQGILRQWYDSESERPEVQTLVLNALALTRVKIRNETVEFLMRLSSKDDAALYALGSSMSGTPSLRVREFLIDLESRSRSDTERQKVIDAIGNSRDPGFVDVLERAFVSGGPTLRETAIYATRFMPKDQVSALLNRARGDLDPGVREAVGRSLRAQTLDPFFLEGN
jgi:hypothetical protein